MTRITIETPGLPRKQVIVEVQNGVFWIGDHLFLFTGLEELIETAKKYLRFIRK